jgi:hypothetical protein
LQRSKRWSAQGPRWSLRVCSTCANTGFRSFLTKGVRLSLSLERSGAGETSVGNRSISWPNRYAGPQEGRGGDRGETGLYSIVIVSLPSIADQCAQLDRRVLSPICDLASFTSRLEWQFIFPIGCSLIRFSECWPQSRRVCDSEPRVAVFSYPGRDGGEFSTPKGLRPSTGGRDDFRPDTTSRLKLNVVSATRPSLEQPAINVVSLCSGWYSKERHAEPTRSSFQGVFNATD